MILLDVMLPGRERLRRLPRPAPARRHDARHHAHGARPGRRQGARPEARRRRLPHEAVRHDGAHRAHRSPAPPARRGRVGRRPTQYQFGDVLVDFRKAEVTRARPVARSVGARVPAAQVLRSSTARRRSHATSCSTRSGAITRCPRRARWTCTSRGSVRRSSRTRGTRSTCSPCTGWATSSSGDLLLDRCPQHV